MVFKFFSLTLQLCVIRLIYDNSVNSYDLSNRFYPIQINFSPLIKVYRTCARMFIKL